MKGRGSGMGSMLVELFKKQKLGTPGIAGPVMRRGGIMKANKGLAVDFDKTTYNVKDVYKLANKNKTGDRTTSKDVREAARILKVKLPPKAR
jgi:hypothetical protein